MPPHIPEELVANSLLELLKKVGIDYIFANIGTEHPPIVNAFTSYSEKK